MIKPENKGERVYRLEQLDILSKNKKCVFASRGAFSAKHYPAIVILNQQGRIILRLFKQGLYVYKKVAKCSK